jgi:hypothetical protein
MASTRIHVKVVPGASRSRVVGKLGDAWKIAVAKPPSGGQANAAVVELLAEVLGVPRNAITIVAGQSNPRKTLEIAGVDAAHIEAALSS